jgi:hypothetical protein
MSDKKSLWAGPNICLRTYSNLRVRFVLLLWPIPSQPRPAKTDRSGTRAYRIGYSYHSAS